MGPAILAFMGFRANGITGGIVGAGLTPNPPVGTFPLPPPMGDVPVELYKEIDFVYLAILSVVAWVSWSKLLVLIRLNSKILSIVTSCINLPYSFFSLVQREREGLPRSRQEKSG